MAKSDVVKTVLTGGETIAAAVAALSKAYDQPTVVSMLERGEYDVLYRKSRMEVTSERRKVQKQRMDLLEKEFVARGGNMEAINAKLNVKK